MASSFIETSMATSLELTATITALIAVVKKISLDEAMETVLDVSNALLYGSTNNYLFY